MAIYKEYWYLSKKNFKMTAGYVLTPYGVIFVFEKKKKTHQCYKML